MSERTDQARVEAARDAFYQARWEKKERLDPLRFGVEWADAHPYSTPEDLAAAYEDGQRDAVSKGMASPQPRTITWAELDEAATRFAEVGASGDWVSLEDMLVVALGALGIEVEDDE